MGTYSNRVFANTWFYVLISGLIVFCQFISVTAQGIGEREKYSNLVDRDGGKNKDLPLDGPYAKNDPRARLGRNLEGVRPMPLPARATAGASNGEALATVGTEYDTRTGQEKNETDVDTTERNRQLNLSSTELLLRSGMIGSSVLPSRDDLSNEKIGDAGDAMNVVIGNDDRQLISPTNFFPRSAVTKLLVRMKNGNEYQCSGAIISPRHVLTAAHCIYSKDDGGWTARVEVIPGLDGFYKPFGSAYSIRIRTYQGWTRYEDRNYDIALITLDRHIGYATGWFGYGYFPEVNDTIGRTMGYPAQLSDGLQIYFDYDRITDSTEFIVYHNIDTTGGQSGSGIYRFQNGDRYIFAVAAFEIHDFGEGGKNGGTLITSKCFNDLREWIENEP